MTTYEERLAAERQADKDRAALWRRLCDDLAPALSEVTGETWTRGPDDLNPWEIEAGRPESAFMGATFTRADGFTIWARGGADFKARARMAAGVLWPRKPGSNGGARYSDAPGVPYNAASPSAGFDPAKGARAVAVQLARVLVAPEYVAAWHGLVGRWQAEADREAAALIWRDKVAEAADMQHVADGGRVYFYPKPGADRSLSITARAEYPGGDLSLKLPRDAGKAAGIVGLIRAALDPRAAADAARALDAVRAHLDGFPDAYTGEEADTLADLLHLFQRAAVGGA